MCKYFLFLFLASSGCIFSTTQYGLYVKNGSNFVCNGKQVRDAYVFMSPQHELLVGYKNHLYQVIDLQHEHFCLTADNHYYMGRGLYVQFSTTYEDLSPNLSYLKDIAVYINKEDQLILVSKGHSFTIELIEHYFDCPCYDNDNPELMSKCEKLNEIKYLDKNLD